MNIVGLPPTHTHIHNHTLTVGGGPFKKLAHWMGGGTNIFAENGVDVEMGDGGDTFIAYS